MYFKQIFIHTILSGALSTMLLGMEAGIALLPLSCTESSAELNKKFIRFKVDTLEQALRRLIAMDENLHKKMYWAAVYKTPLKKEMLEDAALTEEDRDLLSNLLTHEGGYKSQCDKLVAHFCTLDWLQKAIIYMYKREPETLTKFIRALEHGERVQHAVIRILMKVVPVDPDETFLVTKECSFYVASRYKKDIYALIKERYPQECTT